MSSNPFDHSEPVNQTSHNGAGIDLSSFDEDYAAAEAPEHDELPDGKYQVTVNKAQLAESNAGDPMIKWDLVVISGNHEGRHIFKNSVISKKSMPYVKADLLLLGLQLQLISELPRYLPELLDKKLEVTVRTKEKYKNIYFNRLLTIPGRPVSPADVPW